VDISSTAERFRLPGLTLAGELGRGAFGAVFRARHHTLSIDVAVKFIGEEMVEHLGVESVLREARLMARLDHPNLLRILDAGTVTGGIYLVLEFMNGGTCQPLSNLPPDQSTGVLKQLLSATQSLHAAKILHRDIKPANCLRRLEDGRIKLADLGLALDQESITDHWQLAGTVPFMAPELFSFPPEYSERSDLYALGMTAACLMLKNKPFPDGDPDELRKWARSGARPRVAEQRPDVPPCVSQMIDRMTEPEPERRPTSALEALQAILDTRSSLLSGRHSNHTAAKGEDTNGHKDAETVLFDETIGPWRLGPEVYRSLNWEGRLVTHAHTAKAARLMRLLPTGKLAAGGDFILSSAARGAELDHKSIVSVLDWGWHTERAYVVTDDHGKTLKLLAAEQARILESDALGFLWSIADALAWLHDKGIVYQLIDPGAIVVGSDAQTARLRWPVYCVDAGTPSIGEDGSGRQICNQKYAAPEVVDRSATHIHASVDVCGLGATFFYLLAGERRYTKAWKAKPGTMPDFEGIDVTARTAGLLRSMTSINPAQRPTSQEVVNRVEGIAAGLGITLPCRNAADPSKA
jgi:serine/threonine protein kinase